MRLRRALAKYWAHAHGRRALAAGPVMIRSLLIVLLAGPLLASCLVGAAVGATGAVVGAAVGATGAVVGATVDVTGAVIDAATPGDDDDDKDKDDHHHH